MAKIVKKAKKPLGGLRSHSSGGSSVESSPLRPVQIPKTPPCADGCPNETNIREFLTTISWSDDNGGNHPEAFEKAWNILTEKNTFPSVCGRVCPHPWEGNCNRTQKEGAVSINNLERFVGDFALQNHFRFKKINEEKYPEKIAVIGAGPSGLSCAY